MWIEKTKTGYRLCDRIKIDGKTHRVTVPLEKDTPQARRRANEALLEKIKGIEHTDGGMSLNRLVTLYLQKKVCKESTRATCTNALKVICEVLENCPINPTEINRALMESDKSPRTINTYLCIFRTFLHWCYQYGYIKEDISGRIANLPCKKEKVSSDLKYLEPSELKDVLSQLHGMYYYLFSFLALTGCRIGEAAALTMEDIGEKYISITKTDSGHGITEPKTETSTREIFIQPELAALLTEYKRWRMRFIMSKGFRTNLVFFTNNGNHMHRNIAESALRRIKSEKHLHPHIFRHTHVALLAEQGIPLEVIARRIGHEGTGITKAIYYHVTAKQREKDEKAIGKVTIL